MSSRRDFLKTALGASIVAAAAPIVCACGQNVYAEGMPDEPLGTIEIPNLIKTHPVLKTLNGSIIYKPPSPNSSKPIAITCKAADPLDFYVLTAICTHFAHVTVSAYNTHTSTPDVYYCTHAGSEFNIDGSLKRGPAPSPLAAYSWAYDAASDIMTVTGAGLTTVPSEVKAEASNTLFLDQNYPNPVLGKTTISFSTTIDGNIQLVICNLLGNIVSVVHSGFTPAGTHSHEFDATNLPAGTYFYKLITANGTLVKEMIVR